MHFIQFRELIFTKIASFCTLLWCETPPMYYISEGRDILDVAHPYLSEPELYSMC